MYWFFVPPFWMNDINTGTCESGDGFVDDGWDFKNNQHYQYAARGTGHMSFALFNPHDHDMNSIRYGDTYGDGSGEGWPQ
jgi:hypothetical protein